MLGEFGAEIKVSDRVEQLYEFLVPLGDGRAKLAAVHVEVVEQALQVVLAVRGARRALDVAKDALKRLVQILVGRGPLAHVYEELAREDVETLFGHSLLAPELGLSVGQIRRIRNQAFRLSARPR